MNAIRQPLVYQIFKYFVFIFLVLFIIFPLYWIVSTSFRETSEIMNTSLSIIPKTLTMRHYIDAIFKVNILQCLLNSLIITTSTVLICIFTGLLMSYVFVRRTFHGKKALFTIILFTQFIPVVAYIIPLYLIMSRLHILNTYRSLSLSYLGSAFPVAVILLINYIRDVHIELEEAACIDGCTPLEALLRIVIPLSLPGIVSTAIFIFVSVWQEYLIAISFITRESAHTVSIALARFQGAHGTDWGGIMAGAVIISIPVVILFLCSRKTFAYHLAGSIKE
jgi:ABC-type glycerol-3-phosphate transport system permease component